MFKITLSGLLIFLSCICSQISIAATPVMAKKGMVVSEERLASEVGARILRAGGNAIDAAVAVGYALAVVDPCCGNIGGGGFLVARLANGQNIFLNFREKASYQAKRNMYFKNEQTALTGFRAVGVPGTVLGLDTALKKYGRLSRKEVMTPAIQLAEQGFIVTPYLANMLQPYTATFRQQSNIAHIFLRNGHTLKAGDRLIQKDLAKTLRHIASLGPDYFYRGPIAQKIVAASKKHNGILTLDDFKRYRVQSLKPIMCRYHQYTIISAAPPSSGGVALCEMLNILEHFPLKQAGAYSPESVRQIVEAMRYGFIDRNSRLGDPDFVHNPTDHLLSKSYARQISEKIAAKRQVEHREHPYQAHELTDTTHYSVVDGEGNAVAVTYTLNGFFGAEVMAKDTGFFLNNEMDDFAIIPGTPNKFGLVQHDANAIQPGKRPLSSMSPTIVLKDGQLFMVIGSPGGPRIITSTLLTFLNVTAYGMHLQDAVNAPRFHYQAEPDAVDLEPHTLSSNTLQHLERLGYVFTTEKKTWSAVAAILIQNGTLTGVMDYRRPDGAAIGVQ